MANISNLAPESVDIEVDSDLLGVPLADSAANALMMDVLGNKDDTVNGTSVVSLVKTVKANELTLNTPPGADSVANAAMRDVVGNKEDTIAGNSIISLIKGLLAGILVPSKNSTDNANIRDVIGNKTDDESGNSIYSILYKLFEHGHSVQQCYPTLANGVSVTTAAGAWTLGAYAVVIPANTIALPFDIHQIHVSTFSASDTYELVLYSGANGAEVEIGRTRFTRANATNPGSILFFETPIIPANTQIKAKLASANGSAESAAFSVMYHTY